MLFTPSFARALAPVAVLALAAPATAQTADVAKVEAHLAAVQSMTANFTQTDARGRSLRGEMQLKRPGRVRFEYGSGANMLMVANGSTLSFIDYEVGQKSSWALNKTPLGMLLAAKPDIRRIAKVVPNNDPRVLVVRARDARRPEFGTLILAFVKSPSAPLGLLLEGWTAIDAQNKRTTIKLANQRYNVAVADSAFQYAEPKKRKR